MSIDSKQKKLAPKQQRFCQEYIIDLNGQKAATRAGYSERTARQKAHNLLKEPRIAEEINRLKKEIFDRNKITIDEMVSILSSIARFDIASLYNENGYLKNIHDIPLESRHSIEELSVFEEFEKQGKKNVLIGLTKKIKASGKQGAIDKLLKHFGGYQKDNEQKQPDGQTVIVLPSNNRDE